MLLLRQLMGMSQGLKKQQQNTSEEGEPNRNTVQNKHLVTLTLFSGSVKLSSGQHVQFNSALELPSDSWKHFSSD